MVVVDDDPDLRLARIVEGWGVPHSTAAPTWATGWSRPASRAAAVICVETNEIATLEIAMRVREARPDVRLVVQLANPSVGRALERVTGSGQRARRGRPGRPVVRRGLPGPVLPRDGPRRRAFTVVQVTVADDEGYHPTFRSHFGHLAPVAVVPGGRRRDGLLSRAATTPWSAGDRVAVLGTPDELDRSGVDVALATVDGALGAAAPAPAAGADGPDADQRQGPGLRRGRPGGPAVVATVVIHSATSPPGRTATWACCPRPTSPWRRWPRWASATTPSPPRARGCRSSGSSSSSSG